MLSSAASYSGHNGKIGCVLPEFGDPVLAKLVQYDTMRDDSSCCSSESGRATPDAP